MATFPLLFDLGPRRRPTTRDVANTVSDGGTAALTGGRRLAPIGRAIRKSPAARRSTASRACRSVDAQPVPRLHARLPLLLRPPLSRPVRNERRRRVRVGHSRQAQLRRRARRASSIVRRGCGRQVAIGTATDPYQPIEGHYRLTRGALEALARARTPIGLVTKGPMVVRDLDVLPSTRAPRAARST